MTLRTVSYGGGVQSTALLVLAALGAIEFDTFLFANVGDDSEHPATLDYVRNVAMPFAEKHGLTLHELHRVKRDGTSETLWGRLMKEDSRSLPIPVRMNDTGAPGTRSCTADFKIAVIARWLRENGATRQDPATVAIGISVDEIQRAKPGLDPRSPIQVRTYPLLDLGMSRDHCATVIQRMLPVPPKSSCFFCPFHRPEEWRRMKRDEPELFDKSVQLERTLNERRGTLGKDPVWLSRFLKPLDEAISPDGDQMPLWTGGSDDCESGYCMT